MRIEFILGLNFEINSFRHFSDILGIYDEMKPQSLTSIALLLENKKKKEECTEKYRLSLSKLRTEAEKLSE